MIEININDIDKEVARRAYYWCSFDPDKAGERERNDYVRVMTQLVQVAEEMAITEEQKEKAIELLEVIKKGVISRWNACLYAKSKTASSAITGPANFPTRRNEKALRSEDNRQKELSDYIDNAVKIIKKEINKLKPQETKNKELEHKIDIEIAEIVAMIKNPGFYNLQLFRTGFRGRIMTIAKNNPDVIDYIVVKIKSSDTKIFTDKNKFWEEIQAIKDKSIARKEAIDKLNNSDDPAAKQEMMKEVVINGVPIILNKEIDRVQIVFNGKPSYDIISMLKKSAFHWSPSTKTWMRKLTHNAFYAAKEICNNVKEA